MVDENSNPVNEDPISVLRAEVTKCRGTIIKAAGGLVPAKTKVLQKCEDAKLKGKLAADTHVSMPQFVWVKATYAAALGALLAPGIAMAAIVNARTG